MTVEPLAKPMTPLITIADWVSVRDWLVPSIEKTFGTHTEEDVFFLCATGQLKLWRFEKSCAVTEFTEYRLRGMRVLNIFLVGGDLTELMEKEPLMEAFGKENGCTRLTAGGRKGWERTHPAGWHHSCTSLYKDI